MTLRRAGVTLERKMLDTTRRQVLGATVAGAGAMVSTGLAAADAGRAAKTDLGGFSAVPEGLKTAASFPLIEAIRGRRARRFAKGARIPDGPLAYASTEAVEPLTELQQMLLLSTVAGNTGWANLIPFNPDYAPQLPNYAGAAGGRSFPSSAGIQTTEFFFTDDKGTYFLPTRDMAAVQPVAGQGDLKAWLDAHRARIVTLSDKRLTIPRTAAHMERHNTWCANVPGSTLVIPVADLAQHMVMVLCYLVQNGACIYDDVNNRPIPGMERFAGLVNVEAPYPLAYVEQLALAEVTVELSTSCYAGALMLQAMGLGGWMYDGINPFSLLGASGDPEVPGLGFRFDMFPDKPLPFVTGLPGVFEGHCLPHFATMRAAVESVVARKFGPGGPFHGDTGGPYRRSELVRTSAAPMGPEFVDCVTTMAQYIQDTFGRFPATVPAIRTLMYLQAHKLDTGFYDTHFAPGAYLDTHRDHDRAWA
jgi:hypothetical protein